MSAMRGRRDPRVLGDPALPWLLAALGFLLFCWPVFSKPTLEVAYCYLLGVWALFIAALYRVSSRLPREQRKGARRA
ncbi:MAG: hypothetical protein QM765_36325 [Myxococcales bacterium]